MEVFTETYTNVELDDFYSIVPRAKPSDSKKCARCSLYYRETDEATMTCRYHEGKYQEKQSALMYYPSGKWTCCSIGNENDPGCKTGAHIEDITTTFLLSRFNSLDSEPEANTKNRDNAICEAKSNKSSNKTDEKVSDFVKIDSKTYYRHPVTRTDTLAGLAIKYNTKSSEIKRINKLLDDKEIYTKKHVLVPYAAKVAEEEVFDKGQKEEQLLRKFTREFGVTKEEAKYYLSEFTSYGHAAKQLAHDLELERARTEKSSKSQYPGKHKTD